MSKIALVDSIAAVSPKASAQKGSASQGFIEHIDGLSPKDAKGDEQLNLECYDSDHSEDEVPMNAEELQSECSKEETDRLTPQVARQQVMLPMAFVAMGWGGDRVSSSDLDNAPFGDRSQSAESALSLSETSVLGAINNQVDPQVAALPKTELMARINPELLGFHVRNDTPAAPLIVQEASMDFRPSPRESNLGSYGNTALLSEVSKLRPDDKTGDVSASMVAGYRVLKGGSPDETSIGYSGHLELGEMTLSETSVRGAINNQINAQVAARPKPESMARINPEVPGLQIGDDTPAAPLIVQEASMDIRPSSRESNLGAYGNTALLAEVSKLMPNDKTGDVSASMVAGHRLLKDGSPDEIAQKESGERALNEKAVATLDAMRHFSQETADINSRQDDVKVGAKTGSDGFLAKAQIPESSVTILDTLGESNNDDTRPINGLIGQEKLAQPTLHVPISVGARPASASNVATGIAEQMAISISKNPQGSVEIALNPEELGKVHMTMKTVDGALMVVIAAERPETQDLMRRHLDALSQEFRMIGFSDVGFAFTDNDHGGGRHQTDQRISGESVENDGLPLETATRPAKVETGGLDLRL